MYVVVGGEHAIGGKAMAFWNSDEYQAAKPLREGCGDFRVILVDGVQQKPLE